MKILHTLFTLAIFTAATTIALAQSNNSDHNVPLVLPNIITSTVVNGVPNGATPVQSPGSTILSGPIATVTVNQPAVVSDVLAGGATINSLASISPFPAMPDSPVLTTLTENTVINTTETFIIKIIDANIHAIIPSLYSDTQIKIARIPYMQVYPENITTN